MDRPLNLGTGLASVLKRLCYGNKLSLESKLVQSITLERRHYVDAACSRLVAHTQSGTSFGFQRTVRQLQLPSQTLGCLVKRGPCPAVLLHHHVCQNGAANPCTPSVAVVGAPKFALTYYRMLSHHYVLRARSLPSLHRRHSQGLRGARTSRNTNKSSLARA
jgi:hypothetical protein